MILPRDDGDVYSSDSVYDSWSDDVGFIVKWCIMGAIVLAIVFYFVGGYLHAQSRLKKGLQPLPYHRWLIPRTQRPDLVLVTYHPGHYGQTAGSNGQAVGYSEPLPKYEQDAPPAYYGAPPGAVGSVPSASAATGPAPAPPLVENRGSSPSVGAVVPPSQSRSRPPSPNSAPPPTVLPPGDLK